MIERDHQILLHIRRHCRDIMEFIERGGDEDVFINDKMYYNAVTMSIMQIGELAKGMSKDFMSETSSEVPWSNIKGMRDVVAHGYNTLEKHKVWIIANDDIKNLYDFCVNIINKEELHKENKKGLRR